MRLGGYQKLTLLDFPGRVACTVFTDGCNLRCPFCHNASLVLDMGAKPYLEEDDFFTFLKGRIGLLDGVAITGGEPLMQPGILDFIKKIKEMGYAVKLDTNGTFPHILRTILEEKLVDYVAMDIKNCPEKYAETTDVPGLDLSKIEESIALLTSHDTPFEFRTTVVREFHTKEDLVKISHWIPKDVNYFLQSFVDSGELIGSNVSGYSPDEMRELIAAVRETIPGANLRGV